MTVLSRILATFVLCIAPALASAGDVRLILDIPSNNILEIEVRGIVTRNLKVQSNLSQKTTARLQTVVYDNGKPTIHASGPITIFPGLNSVTIPAGIPSSLFPSRNLKLSLQTSGDVTLGAKEEILEFPGIKTRNGFSGVTMVLWPNSEPFVSQGIILVGGG